MQTLSIVDRPVWLPSSAWPWPTYALRHDTGRIAVTDIGRGPAVLFVHVGSWSFVWRDVLARLQSDFRCVALDAPGCGLSARSGSAPTLTQAGDAVAAVIDALELSDVTLVAHDLGGPAGFLAATRRSDRVAALAAVNCFAWKPTGPAFRGMLAAMGSGAVRELDAATAVLPRITSTAFGWADTGADRIGQSSGPASTGQRVVRGTDTSVMPASPTRSTARSKPGSADRWRIGHC